MCNEVHKLNPPPLSFPLFVFLSTSHARTHSVVTLLSLILPLFSSVLQDVTFVFFLSAPSHICPSSHSV